MPEFHRLKIREVRHETADCVSVAFEVPERLQEAYRFLPGQHLTLSSRLNGEEVRRSYSICAAPFEQELRVAIKRIEGGRFSTYANEALKPGDELEVMTPTGRFCLPPLHGVPKRQIVAFAAGSGITPIISILKTVLETEPESTCTLFYANRRPDTIIFLEEIEGLKNRHLQRFSVYHVLSRQQTDSPLFSGRIDADKCRAYCRTLLQIAHTDAFYLCGPAAMVDTLRKTLLEQGAQASRIHTELFVAPEDVRQAAPVPLPAAVAARIGVRIDGRSFEFPLEEPGLNLLDASLRAGANLPYACKGGVCCTCKARLLEGQVHLARNYGLEPDEIAAGYILTCQAYPLSQTVQVDFDV